MRSTPVSKASLAQTYRTSLHTQALPPAAGLRTMALSAARKDGLDAPRRSVAAPFAAAAEPLKLHVLSRKDIQDELHIFAEKELAAAVNIILSGTRKAFTYPTPYINIYIYIYINKSINR